MLHCTVTWVSVRIWWCLLNNDEQIHQLDLPRLREPVLDPASNYL